MRLLPVIAILVALWALSPLARAQVPAATCTLAPVNGEMRELTSNGRKRTYRLFVPPTAGQKQLPLVLDLHGSGGNATERAKNSGFEVLAAREGFAVATLQAEDSRWNVPASGARADDVQYASDVIDHVAARSCIDATRVYATGFSGGGRMSSLLGCRLNDRIAAIGPVGGLRWFGPCPGRAVPVITLHGTADLTSPYEGHGDRGAEWVESVPEALAGWASHNRCQPRLVQEDPPGPAYTVRYDGCAAGTEVRLARIDGLGHVWPHTEIDATETVWQFFKTHSLQ